MDFQLLGFSKPTYCSRVNCIVLENTQIGISKMLVEISKVLLVRAEKKMLLEEYVIGNWRKGNLCCVVAESLAEFCPVVV